MAVSKKPRKKPFINFREPFMTTITLESIKSEQDRLAEMIAKFEAQFATAFIIPETEINLAPGEHYAGLILGKDGEPSHHLILLPDEPTDALNWEAAKHWAKRVGGDLPTRREQSLMYANLKEQFESAWYWSGEAYTTDGYAWFQYFYIGSQYYGSIGSKLRARAVRRLIIE